MSPETAQMALEALKNGKRVREFEGGTRYQPELEDKAIAAIEAEIAQPDGWRTIQTAPKDEKIIAACKEGVFIIRWRDYCVYNSPEFTHWMPPPAAPKA